MATMREGEKIESEELAVETADSSYAITLQQLCNCIAIVL